MTRLRQAAAWLLVVVSVSATVVAALALWTRRELFDSTRVAGGVRSALTAPAVQASLVDEITEQVMAGVPAEASPARPRIRAEIETLVAGEAFGDAFEDAVRTLHARLVEGDGERRLVFDLSPMGPLVTEAVGRVDPRLVPFVDVQALRAVELGEAGEGLPDLRGLRDRFDGAAATAGAVALGSLVAAVAVARRRHRVVRGAGILVAMAGLGVAALTFPASGLLVDTVDQEEARAVVDAFVGHVAAGLRMGALAVVAAGALAAAAAAWWEHRPRAALVS